MKKLLVVFVLLVFGLSACKKNEQTAVTERDMVTVEHNSGKTDVPKNAQRVIILDYSSADTLEELGLSDVVVGIPKGNLPQYLSSYNDSKYADIGGLKDFDYEKINNLSPDLIIISDRQQPQYEELSKIAPTINLNINNSDYLGSYKNNTRLMGMLWEKQEKAEEIIKDIEVSIEKLVDKTKEIDASGLVVLYNAGKFSAYGSGSRFGIIHDDFGLKQADTNIDVSTHGQSITSEYIVKLNPDYLFIVDRNTVITKRPTNKDEIENKLIQMTNAYKNGKIIYLPADHWYLANGGSKSIKLMISDVYNGL